MLYFSCYNISVKDSNKKGFTIVEVLVVIGIIAVLTVLILPSISNIRAKNRDTERVADISALQLGLSLYKNQIGDNSYPESLTDPVFLTYVNADTLSGPTGDNLEYEYVPLKRGTGTTKCTYYHLGVKLELPSGQIDTADNFISLPGEISNGYAYCGDYNGPGLATGTLNYNVHP